MHIAISKLTSKSQASIPAKVRKLLNLRPGDSVAYELADDGSVRLRKAQPLDAAYAAALGETLPEWGGEFDEKAYAGL